MSSSTFDHLRANVEGAVAFVDLLEVLLSGNGLEDLDAGQIETLADHGIDLAWVDFDEFDASDAVHDLINAGVLEVYGSARVTADTVDVREVVAVTGVGGPHIEFGVDFNGRVVARGFWGSDRIERVTSAPAVGEFLADIVGGWDR